MVGNRTKQLKELTPHSSCVYVMQTSNANCTVMLQIQRFKSSVIKQKRSFSTHYKVEYNRHSSLMHFINNTMIQMYSIDYRS